MTLNLWTEIRDRESTHLHHRPEMFEIRLGNPASGHRGNVLLSSTRFEHQVHDDVLHAAALSRNVLYMW